MSRYAMVAIIEAGHPTEAWEKFTGLIAKGEGRKGDYSDVVYVGGPHDVPEDDEYQTDGIVVNGVDLNPSDELKRPY